MTGRAVRAALAAGAALLVLVATLPPTGAVPHAPRLFADRAAADFIANLMLFLPLGMALAGLGWRASRAVGAAAALSLSVEVAQLWIPGRYPSLGDLAANTLGTAFGYVLVRRRSWLLNPPRIARPRLAAAALAGALGVFFMTLALAQPAATQMDYFGQWTPELAQFQRYRGRVLDVTLAGESLPSGRLPSSNPARARLVAGAPLRVTAILGPEPDDLADLFSIYDRKLREIVLVGVDHADLVYHYRTRAAALLLDVPDLRVSGALHGFSPGDTVSLGIERARDGWCVQVAAAQHCGIGYSAGSGWGLIWYPSGLPGRLETAVDWLWVAGIALVVGYWPRPAAAAAATAALVALLAALPVVLRQPLTPPGEYAALVLGVGAGQLAWWIMASRRSAPARPGTGQSGRTTS